MIQVAVAVAEGDSMAPNERTAGDWLLEREIGSGSFAKVWRATHRYSGQVAAVKEINLDKLNKKLQDSLASEVAVLRHISHDNIVGLLELIKDNNKLYIVLEFCAGGDLGHYIKRYRQVSEATARYFLQQLAEGLKELRKHNVIHRDLKPQNLLLHDSSSTPLLKIADFGFARPLAPQGLAETLCGSPLYMAPEILQFHKYDAKADLWSIGTILFELLVGNPPFNGANHTHLLHNIERSEARLPEHNAARLSAHCKGLLDRLLQRNPVERITFEEFFQHPFLTGVPGPSAGVPPPRPTAAAAAWSALQGKLPPAIRQAAAAVTAAGAAAPPAHAQQPSLHLHGPTQESVCQSYQPLQAEHLQQQYNQQPQQAQAQPHLQPGWHQPQQHYVAAVPYLQQQQLLQQQQPSQPPTKPGLIPQPVTCHPLAHDAAGQHNSGLEDSMDDDFVVVYNPSGSMAPTKGSNSSSSKASSGLVDPKAAAVLQGTAVAGTTAAAYRAMPPAVAGQASPAQQVQVQQSGYHHNQQQQHSIMPQEAVHGLEIAPAAHIGVLAAGIGSCVLPTTGYVNAPSLHLQPTPQQRVQLLVAVVRGCLCLLNHQEEHAQDAAAPAAQPGRQIALLLLALQVVQALCLPHRKQQQHAPGEVVQEHLLQQQLSQGGYSDEASSLSELLSAASQHDLEQLMAAAMELLQLAQTLQGTDDAADYANGMSGYGEGSALCRDNVHPAGSAAGAKWGLAVGCPAASVLHMPLPDPYAVLYQEALASCRAAAVEEVMANWQASIIGYSLAADLLLFLSQAWPGLGAAGPALLPAERLSMHRLYVAVNARLAAVLAEAPSAMLYA